MAHRRPSPGFALLALWGLPTGIARAAPPNIVLISVDGLRADRTHFGGNPRPTTPSLDAFVTEGMRFPLSFSQSNESAFSHASMFTGRYASEIAFPDYWRYLLPEEALSLPELLGLAGYDTGAFIAGGHIKASFGFSQGFDEFHEGPDFGSFFSTVPSALAWLEKRQSDKPFFLFLHGYDCHRPYAADSVFHHAFEGGAQGRLDQALFRQSFSESVYQGTYYPSFRHELVEHANGELILDPEGYSTLASYVADYQGDDAVKLSKAQLDHVLAHYDGSVLAADTYVGLFLDALREQGLWEDTLVVVTSDHGEDLQTHGYYNHRAVLFDSTTRVPLVLGGGALPPALRGVTRPELTAAVDLVPTLAEVAEIASPADARGRSLWPLTKGQETLPKPHVYQEGVLGQTSLRTATHRLVFSGYALTDPDYLRHLIQAPLGGGAFALYHTAQDVEEAHDVLKEQSELATELRRAMVTIAADLVQGSAQQELSPELREMMRENGYW